MPELETYLVHYTVACYIQGFAPGCLLSPLPLRDLTPEIRDGIRDYLKRTLAVQLIWFEDEPAPVPAQRWRAERRVAHLN